MPFHLFIFPFTRLSWLNRILIFFKTCNLIILPTSTILEQKKNNHFARRLLTLCGFKYSRSNYGCFIFFVCSFFLLRSLFRISSTLVCSLERLTHSTSHRTEQTIASVRPKQHFHHITNNTNSNEEDVRSAVALFLVSLSDDVHPIILHHLFRVNSECYQPLERTFIFQWLLFLKYSQNAWFVLLPNSVNGFFYQILSFQRLLSSNSTEKRRIFCRKFICTFLQGKSSSGIITK